jgi:Zn-dependent peptidase ImmA (M78 family)
LVRSETRQRAKLRFRKTPKKLPYAAEARAQEIAVFLSQNELISLVPHAPRRVRASLQARPSVELAAEQIREAICDDDELLDPLPDLVERIDRAGLASSIVLHDLGIEGASTTINGKGVIVIAGRTFGPRMLFTCAHELAHVMLGHTDSGEWLIDLDALEGFDIDHEEERLCNALASAVLQPAAGVARFLQLVREHIEVPPGAVTATDALLVARYFGTSFLTAAMRLEYLEIAPTGSALAFQRMIKADHKSLEAYAEQLGLPPRTKVRLPLISPVRSKRITSAIEVGDISIGRVGDVFGYSTIEISDALARTDH